MFLEKHLSLINTATKYPSIPTYHALGEKGALIEDQRVEFPEEDVYLAEKIEGTNSRIIAYRGDWLLGSREELIYAAGDRIVQDTMGIVQVLKAIAARASELYQNLDALVVYYFETYGGKIDKHWKRYTKDPKRKGARLFDVALIPAATLRPMLDKGDRAKIAAWRDRCGHLFSTTYNIEKYAEAVGAELAPSAGVVKGADLPQSPSQTLEFLERHLPKTLCALEETDEEKAEGLVIRTCDRSTIAKIRYEDYERHFFRRK